VTPERPLPPGSTIGILGGGQLGRMLAMAAAELGFRVHIYAPKGDNPAIDVAHTATIADWSDESVLGAFAGAADVVTYEFENIPVDAVSFLADRVPVQPGVEAIAVAQDRLAEKTMATGLGLAVAPYAPVDSPSDLAAALEKISVPAILKTRHLGYDGKGQAPIDKTEDAEDAWLAIGATPAILEQRVDFRTEISVILARAADGTMHAFDVPQNRHAGGILATSTVPASISEDTAGRAIAIAEQIAAALGYVGVLAVEMFVSEIAPRVHNSGHWTTDACLVSQFEQHIRAICGWPLAEPLRHSDVTMTNLIGADVERWAELAAEPDARVHLYGKSEIRPGRKMGHVNRIAPRRD
jgi:5-(carboxyamino)imidazole ribonucleotide synthase